jgi:hypothetical protein
MSDSVFALPVSVEQIATVIKQMSPTDQKRLLELVPNLRQIATESTFVRTEEQTQANIAHLRAEVLAALNHQLLSPDEPFLGDLTLGQYLALPDEEKTKLWDEWADIPIPRVVSLIKR